MLNCNEIIDEEYWVKINHYSNGKHFVEEQMMGLRIDESKALFDLSFAERNLNDGRFLFYTPISQEYKIIVPIDFEINNSQAVHKLLGFIDWIAKHSPSSWSIEAWRPRYHHRKYKFSFEDLQTAIFFKMVFC